MQTTYAELLEDYLHAKRRFLSEAEIASCLMQYLRSSGNRSARLQTAGAAQMRYGIIRWKDGVERLCETAFFEQSRRISLYGFLPWFKSKLSAPEM